MELRDAFINKIVCHHFSVNPSKCLINNALMDLAKMDTDLLREFFIKPFSSIKTEFIFSHPVDMSYNVVYQTALKVVQGEDFVKCSQHIFKQLQAVSTYPTIRNGDVFIASVSDIIIGDSYFDGLAIVKIERKSEFIETFLGRDGSMQFAIKNGFSSNKIDKACLIVFTEKIPRCFVIESGNDFSFWCQDFLGLSPKANAYSQSKAAIQVFQSFVKEELGERADITKGEKVSLLNDWTEQVRASDSIQLKHVADIVIQDDGIRDMFLEYSKRFEEREGINLSESFEVDRKAVSLPKRVRTIKLDDTAEINLMKTGEFIERGFDERRRLHYYKLYFSKEE